MQIVFVLSDGRFGEREGVKQWIREAESNNMLLVFIIIDNPNPKDSILQMQTVSYPNGKLQITRYIDNFPFPYYIILNNIHSLPSVLADAVRQWFELLKQ